MPLKVVASSKIISPLILSAFSLAFGMLLLPHPLGEGWGEGITVRVNAKGTADS